jgi:hypothetical protein
MTLPRRDPDLAVRRIHFYHVDVGRDDEQKRIEFRAAQALRPLANLDFMSGDAYHEAGDKVTCGWLDRDRAPIRLRAADIRRTNLPQIESSGALTALAIDANSGLAEQVHVQFFPDNIAGSDFNFYGPRMSRIAQFVAAKTGTTVTFLPMLRGSVVEELRRLEEIRLFEIGIQSSVVEELNRSDGSVGGLFRGAASFAGVDRVDVILRVQRGDRSNFTGRIKEAARALLGNARAVEGMAVLKATGVTDEGHSRELDLLKDDLRVERSVLRKGDGSRALDSDSVYSAIESAHEELREELTKAHGTWWEG